MVYIDGILRPEWKFIIYFLDSEHMTATCIGPIDQRMASEYLTPPLIHDKLFAKGIKEEKEVTKPFTILSLKDILSIMI